MKRILASLFLVALAALTLAGAAAKSRNPAAVPTSNRPVPPAAPKIEVCFVLDTTGSMGGLIEAAKQKIWSISNQIVKAKPTPELRVGLVAYRDRGDEYVTKSYALTDDIDTVYGQLMGFVAAGGGDEPESVNKALAVAVNQMEWSKNPDVLKMIFLVGDAPPHMDYADDVKYPVTCEVAARRGILINTVQCGNLPETRLEWQRIAKLAEGHYVAIAQDGNVAVMATPMDAKLAALNRAVGETLVPYGKEVERQEVASKQSLADASFAVPASTAAAADRLAYNHATGKAVQGNHELVNDYEKDRDVLKKITAADLPTEFKDKTPAELETYVQAKSAARRDMEKQIGELSQERESYLVGEKKKRVNHLDAFDEQVAKILVEEARAKASGH